MSFLDHLGELRGHLIRSVIAIIIAAVFIGINTNWVVDNILFYPTKPDFPTFKYINYFTQEYLGEESISLPETFPIQVRKLYEQFNVFLEGFFWRFLILFGSCGDLSALLCCRTRENIRLSSSTALGFCFSSAHYVGILSFCHLLLILDISSEFRMKSS